MRAIVKKIVGSSLDETQLHQIIERIVEDLDPNEEGKIDFYQFAKIFQVSVSGGSSSPTTHFPGQESL
jgi:Ca2+-binding EF-hand superfamily protein